MKGGAGLRPSAPGVCMPCCSIYAVSGSEDRLGLAQRQICCAHPALELSKLAETGLLEDVVG